MTTSMFRRAIAAVALSLAAVAGLADATAQEPEGPMKAARDMRNTLCRNPSLLSCIKTDRATCEKLVGPEVENCAKNPGVFGQNPQLLQGLLLGCAVNGLLKGGKETKDAAVACVQAAGKKSP